LKVAADFFDRQDAARRNTTRLVVLFALAVLAIMVSIHVLLAGAFGYLAYDARTGGPGWSLLLDPGLASLAVIGTLIVVGGGSLFKIVQLRGGGQVVAEQLGGRLLNPDTADPSERQLMNVVEEMAIASGTTTPPVYLLDQEDGINAFAAGFTPGEAVIGVTRGAARRLSRDELQGVIAHEFSHILNGDMRLNIRLIGLLHGILIIGMLGYFVLRMTAFSGHRARRSRDQGNPLPLLAVGVGLMVVGFFGTFFGNLIKAAVSRQREFLADAAAVQFTRQPGGIAGALKKIGALAAGSAIRSPNAPEASHMFFGRATSGFGALFSTHPPLPTRIRRIEPSWDGAFPDVAPVEPAGRLGTARPAATVGFAAADDEAGRVAPSATHALDEVGRPSQAHVRYAERLLDSLPGGIRAAAHEPYGARALIYALLLDRDAALRTTQLQHLQRAADPGVFEETLRLAPGVARLETRARLPVVEITLPALRSLTPSEYGRFKQNVAVLVEADEGIDVFEWSLQRILLHGLDAHHEGAKRPRVRHERLGPLQPQCEVLLSVLARAGHRDEQAARQAFDAATQALGLPGARMRGAGEADLNALDAALAELEEAAPQVKRRVLEAVVACIAADRQISVAEAELLRAIASSLGVPMPPLLGGSASGQA
jgi:Zn-dependent protease with chaperone function